MNAVTQESQFQGLLNGIDIPPSPAILVAIDAELKKEDANQREIARLISQDVALAGHVMHIANSPAFSTGRTLTSIAQALSVLGSNQVFNLVICHLLKLALSGKQDAAMHRFWETSSRTAAVSAELAMHLGSVRPDVAYTFGLFHDCGIPLIMKRFPKAREALAAANAAEDRLFTDVEDAMLGTNHAVVGYFLAKRWHLADFIAEGVRHHHDYSVLIEPGRVSDAARRLISVCVLAEHIIRLHGKGNGEYEWPKAAENASVCLGLSLGAVDDLIEDMRDGLD